MRDDIVPRSGQPVKICLIFLIATQDLMSSETRKVFERQPSIHSFTKNARGWRSRKLPHKFVIKRRWLLLACDDADA